MISGCFWIAIINKGECNILKVWFNHFLKDVFPLGMFDEDKKKETKRGKIQDSVIRLWNFTINNDHHQMELKKKTTLFFHSIIYRKKEIVRLVNNVIQDLQKKSLNIIKNSYHKNDGKSSQPSQPKKEQRVDKVFRSEFWKRLEEKSGTTNTKKWKNISSRLGRVCVPFQKNLGYENLNDNNDDNKNENNGQTENNQIDIGMEKKFRKQETTTQLTNSKLQISLHDYDDHDVITHDEKEQKIRDHESDQINTDYFYYAPNMVLQVITSSEMKNFETEDSSDPEATSQGEIPCCLIDVSDAEINNEEGKRFLSSYQLLEQVYGQLGLIDVHRIDYAYKPVLSSSRMNKGIVSSTDTFKSPQLQPNSQQQSQKRRREWIFSKFGYGSGSEHFDNDYQRMDDHAFAGGSQGEVWRARKRCNQIQLRKNQNDQGTDTDPDSHFENASNNNRQRSSEYSSCDEKKRLIMKRLKVENGFKLLEAGLREVYFGDLLLSSINNEPALFTKYVDHFFLKTSTTVDLWIVYEDAGPSMRSLIYTPVSTSDFILYQHSSLWRFLRSDIAGIPSSPVETTSSAVSVHLAEQRASTSTSQPKETEETSDYYEESTDRAWADNPFKNHTNEQEFNDVSYMDGKYVLKSILKQILTSAAYLHKQGIVHRDIKPSNIMCQIGMKEDEDQEMQLFKYQNVNCVLGDFSSAIDEYTSHHLYSGGPSIAEQTDEYTPPEILLRKNKTWNPFTNHRKKNMESYDSWSIGVVILELLLGTPNGEET